MLINNKRKWVICTVAILIITNILAFSIGNRVSLSLPNGNVEISKANLDEVLKFQKMFAVRDQLYKYYDGKIDDNALVNGAIKGMTNALNDPYTVFMDANETQSFNNQIQGQEYVGIGIQVENRDNKVTVNAVFDGSPAEKAGIKAGDAIVKIDGTAIAGADLNKAVSMMKGKENTNVTLTIARTGRENFDVVAQRKKIAYNTVTGQMLSNNIGYIDISMFDENTGENFDKKLQELKAAGMKGLILDLRDNGGGVLDDCLKVASNFIDKGKTVVYTVDKNNKKQIYKSEGGNTVGIPLVVLTNGNTASASEIFSGAIKDYKAGTLIGEKTFGKGVVQTTFNTGDNTQLKVTISKWYTPLNENINHSGFQPDIEVKYPQDLLNKPYDRNSDPQFQKALEVINSKVK